MDKWYVYILKCSDRTLYTGVTNDIERRVNKHNQGTASKYTRGRRPVTLVYKEEYKEKNKAYKREYQLKKLTRKQKQSLFDRKNNKTLSAKTID